MDQPDTTIHQPVRLKIMAALKALPDREQVEFVRLKALVGATEGNLGAHLTTLEQAGYIEIEKDFVAKKPRTRVRLARAGRRALENYIGYLREIVDATAETNTRRTT
jgi:DNA-binding MarR family transcriptional regulator